MPNAKCQMTNASKDRCFRISFGICQSAIGIFPHTFGSGGGAAAKRLESSPTVSAGTHAAIPCFQTSVWRVNSPDAALPERSETACGPDCAPFTAMKYAAGCGTGGGPDG